MLSYLVILKKANSLVSFKHKLENYIVEGNRGY